MNRSTPTNSPQTVRREGKPDLRILSWTPPILILEVEGEIRRVFLTAGQHGGWYGIEGQSYPFSTNAKNRVASEQGTEAARGDLDAPMPGRVLKILVSKGDSVESGQRLLILEAMKMELPIRAPQAGVVRDLHVTVDQSVDPGQPLIEIDEGGSA